MLECVIFLGQWLLASLILVAPLPAAIHLCCFRAGRTDAGGGSHQLFEIATLWFFAQTAIALLIGACGVLNLAGLLVAEGALLTAGIAALCRRPRASVKHALSDLVRPLFTLDHPQQLLLRLLGVAALTMFARNLITPTIAWDALMYHMPTMATWLHYGFFVMFDQWFGGTCYPYGWELIGTLFMVPLGNDLLALFPNVLIWMYLGLGVYALATSLDASPRGAMVAAALALGSPMILELSMGVYAEVALLAFFIAGLFYSVTYVQTGDAKQLSFMFLNTGMMIGVKQTGLLYGACLAAALLAHGIVYVIGRQRTVRSFLSGIGQHYRLLIVSALLACLVGGFWYSRNLVRTGNPLGFVPISIAGIPIFQVSVPLPPILQNVTAGCLANIFNVRDPAHWAFMWKQFLEHFWLAGVSSVVGAVGFVFGLFLPGTRTQRTERVLLLALIMVTFWLYVTTPFSGTHLPDRALGRITGFQMRFGLPCCALLAVAAGLAARGILGGILSLLAHVAVLMAIFGLCFDYYDFGLFDWTSAAVIGKSFTIFVGLLVKTHATQVVEYLLCAVAFLGIHLAASRLWQSWGRAGLLGKVSCCLGYAVLFCASSLVAFSASIEQRAAKVTRYGDVYTFINTSVKDGDTIAHTHTHKAYWYFKDGWRNSVVYVPAADKRPEEWIASLRKAGADFVGIGPGIKGAKPLPELEWVRRPEYARLFTQVFGGSFATAPYIFRINWKDYAQEASHPRPPDSPPAPGGCARES